MANEFNKQYLPSPLFVGEKERNFIKQVTTEVAERVNGQGIFYYPIDIERSNFHPLYGESLYKTFYPPIAVYAFVEWDGLKTDSSTHGLDKATTLTIHFHKRRLTEDQDIYVREGDFIKYGEFFYEITTLEDIKPIAGQIDFRYEISAKCVRAREGTFDGQ